MKKYRLITCDTESVGCDKIVKGEYSDSLEAMMQAVRITKDSTNLYYRIEEVEESIMDKVKSYEDAWKIRYGNRDGLDIRDNYIRRLNLIADKALVWHLAALIDLETITAALNEGWKPDWENQSQKKWIVWYSSETEKCKASDQSVCCMTSSRLYFKSRELAEYAAKQFAELYKQLLIEKF